MKDELRLGVRVALLFIGIALFSVAAAKVHVWLLR